MKESYAWMRLINEEGFVRSGISEIWGKEGAMQMKRRLALVSLVLVLWAPSAWASDAVKLDPMRYEHDSAFVKAVRFLDEIGVEASVCGVKDNMLYVHLAGGGMAEY